MCSLKICIFVQIQGISFFTWHRFSGVLAKECLCVNPFRCQIFLSMKILFSPYFSHLQDHRKCRSTELIDNFKFFCEFRPIYSMWTPCANSLQEHQIWKYQPCLAGWKSTCSGARKLCVAQHIVKNNGRSETAIYNDILETVTLTYNKVRINGLLFIWDNERSDIVEAEKNGEHKSTRTRTTRNRQLWQFWMWIVAVLSIKRTNLKLFFWLISHTL